MASCILRVPRLLLGLLQGACRLYSQQNFSEKLHIVGLGQMLTDTLSSFETTKRLMAVPIRHRYSVLSLGSR